MRLQSRKPKPRRVALYARDWSDIPLGVSDGHSRAFRSYPRRSLFGLGRGGDSPSGVKYAGSPTDVFFWEERLPDGTPVQIRTISLTFDDFQFVAATFTYESNYRRTWGVDTNAMPKELTLEPDERFTLLSTVGSDRAVNTFDV